MARVRIGISGFRYKSWRGLFYPVGLRQRDELAYAAERFESIELNGSFYSLQRPESFAAWRDETPKGFVFAVKGGRFITHMKKLRDVHVALANFFASGPLCLEEKLGPVLWQFPENMPCDLARFDAFFQALPRDTRHAGSLAEQCAPFMHDRSATRSARKHRIRHAVEIRNPACATPEFIALLRRHRIALVIADTAGRFPFVEDVTADFMYVRLHGHERLYQSQYGKRELTRWAERIAAWQRGDEPHDAERIAAPSASRKPRDVYVYFDNDAKAHAPWDALSLRRALESVRSTNLCTPGVRAATEP